MSKVEECEDVTEVIEPEEEYEYQESKVGSEPSEEKQSIVEELYSCDKRISKLINSWDGNGKEDAIAGRKFLNNQFSVLIGIVNTTNSFTKKHGDECQKILYRANQGFIVDMVNEPTIHRKDYYSLFFTFWHCVELFLGLPRNGHGSNVLRDALAGLNTPQEEEKPTGILDDWRRRKNV